MQVDLAALARKEMLMEGFRPDLDPGIEDQLAELPRESPRATPGAPPRDLRALPWSSIDNAESRALGQIEAAEALADGRTRVLVGIADVDALVPRGSPVDVRASVNTTSVYTGVVTFPMLPEVLSTDLSSLNQDEDRLAIVIDMVIDAGGVVAGCDAYRALVRNRARLAYDEVSAWLEGSGAAPPRVAASPEIQAQLALQDTVARALKARRYEQGALDLETIEARPVTRDGRVTDLVLTRKGRARDLIEDFMIAANGAMARFLASRGLASIRRVVRAPERWQRIVALAKGLGEALPDGPDGVALARFLSRRRAQDPAGFPDLSLAVVKLMGPGEYALERPGEPTTGHFGLAVQDYTHSTAPNRRFADLVTQRSLKAALAGEPPPYDDEVLDNTARRCTEKENDAKKVERFMRKAAAAVFLAPRIGETFDAVVTGVKADKGTFVRLERPPAEWRLVRGERGLDVGDRLPVRLVATDPVRGYLDFERA